MNPCYYGTDIDSRDYLIACRYPMDEIADAIGADSLGYLSVSNLGMLIGNETGVGYCDACFSGEYATDVPEEGNKNIYDRKLSEKAGEKK